CRAAHDAQLLRARRGRGEHRQRVRRRTVRGAGRAEDRPVIGWLDCAAGASGDMLLGALVDAGVPVETLQGAVDVVAPEPVELRVSTVERHGIGAVKVDVHTAESSSRRTWGEVRTLLGTLPEPIRVIALDAFARLARAEAAVHRVDPEDVHFHEVGALDAIADVVGVAAGLHALGLQRLAASPVTVGSGGTARSGHGVIPVPAPAVLGILAEAGAPVRGGPLPDEMCTPTGAALLAAAVTGWGPLPELVPVRTGVGAGGRDPAELPNVVRLVLGEPVGAAATAVVLETNVDDLDPRLWPDVLDRLLAAGASDAWLTPILMKKGRPAHTLSVLVAADRVEAVRREVYRHTTSIGLREQPVGKRALDRELVTVDVEGHTVKVKLARLDGELLNLQPEYEHVAAA